MPSTYQPTILFTAHSERVKCIEIHPKEPLFLSALYNGVVHLWNYSTETLLKSFDTSSNTPVRCVRFIPRLQSFACGADDMHIRVYNYHTMVRTKTFQAHEDYIRDMAVVESMNILLTASDDMKIRQWNWNNGWALQATYEGHTNYVMSLALNPKDASTFASGSMDWTIKIWNFNNSIYNFQLEGHEEGVNSIDYYPRGDKPYLISGSDDRTVCIWDYQTKACLHRFTFHTENISSVRFHPDHPLIFTAGEDNEIKIISSDTFRLLYSLDHSNMARAWTIGTRKYLNMMIVGYDNGVVMYKVGEDKPVFSMDPNGRIFFVMGNELSRMDLKSIPADISDGEVLNLSLKEMTTLESNAKAIFHGPSGQYFSILGERDYTIISTLSQRPKSYGSCISFAWGQENGAFAVLEDSITLKLYKGFKEKLTLRLPENSQKVFSGPLLAVSTANNVTFYDWETGLAIRQVCKSPSNVQWNATGDLLALTTTDDVFILRFNAAHLASYLEQNGTITEAAAEGVFDLVEQIEESITELVWAGECLIFLDQGRRLNYFIGGESHSISVLEPNHFLLGYLAKENRIFCIDKERHVTSYTLSSHMIEYMTAVIHEDFSATETILQRIPEKYRPQLARFLQQRGRMEEALAISTDLELRFELAMQLNRLELAKSIISENPSTQRWKQLGDAALQKGFLPMAIEAYTISNDHNGLLLIFSSMNDFDALLDLAGKTQSAGKFNIAFTCFMLTKRYEDALELLLSSKRLAEAAFFARTYCPKEMERVITSWKASLSNLPRIMESIATPSAYPNLFPSISQKDDEKNSFSEIKEQELNGESTEM